MNKNETQLSSSASTVWALVQQWSDYLGVCWRSLEAISQRAGISREDVVMALGELESLGMIRVKYGTNYVTIETEGFYGGDPDPEPEPLEMPYAARKILDDTILSWAEKGLALYVLANPGKSMSDIEMATSSRAEDLRYYLEQLEQYGYIEHAVLPTKGSKK